MSHITHNQKSEPFIHFYNKADVLYRLFLMWLITDITNNLHKCNNSTGTPFLSQ